MNLNARLTKKSITLSELISISYDFYRKKDDKAWRSSQDIVNARISRRTNFKYNPGKREWEQTGRDVLIVFTVRSNPKSYKTNSKIKNRYYPISFLVHDVSKGINSPVKIREGSNFKPHFTKSGMTKQQRETVEKRNITKGIQLQAFFDSQWVYKQYGILFGPCYAIRPPRKRNPDLIPFLSKHSFFCATKILLPLLGKEGLKLKQLWKNEG
jgi:hypothetical protein